MASRLPERMTVMQTQTQTQAHAHALISIEHIWLGLESADMRGGIDSLRAQLRGRCPNAQRLPLHQQERQPPQSPHLRRSRHLAVHAPIAKRALRVAKESAWENQHQREPTALAHCGRTVAAFEQSTSHYAGVSAGVI